MSDARQRAALAERAARAGGAVARDLFRAEFEVETKADKNDLVTDADREAQRQVVHTVVQEFPDEAFLCEETLENPGGEDSPDTPKSIQRAGPAVETVPESGACWVVDPVDGTANFARGLRIWGTSIAATIDGETVAAATYLPALQDIYTVGPDSASRNGQPLRTSERTDPETFAVGLVARWSIDSSDRFGALARQINRHFGDSRRFGSYQATLGMVASGELDAAVTTEPSTPWDTLAGVELVRAAGGSVTDLDGSPWTLDTDGLIASNGTAHDDVVDAAQRAMAE
ncbi:MAG: inositol monophosphatase [Halapricum sp.]